MPVVAEVPDNDGRDMLLQSGAGRLRELLGIAEDDFCNSDVAKMAEAYISLPFPESATAEIETGNNICRILADAYARGDVTLGLSFDPRKAKMYSQEENHKGAGKRTEKIYHFAGWFTSCRLFLSRSAQFFNLFSGSFVRAVLHNMQHLTRIGGLSYGIELLFDIAIVLKETFFPTKMRGNIWTRFRDVLNKDNRPHRMANAAVWFAVNLCGFFLTGGVSSILNVASFAFDIVNDTWKFSRETSGYGLLKKLHKKKIADAAIRRDSVALNKSKMLITRISGKIREIRNNQKKQLMTSCAIFVGAALFLLAPGGPAVVAGAALIFAASLFGGFGKKVMGQLCKTERVNAENMPLYRQNYRRVEVSPKKNNTFVDIHDDVHSVQHRPAHSAMMSPVRNKPVAGSSLRETVVQRPQPSFISDLNELDPVSQYCLRLTFFRPQNDTLYTRDPPLLPAQGIRHG